MADQNTTQTCCQGNELVCVFIPAGARVVLLGGLVNITLGEICIDSNTTLGLDQLTQLQFLLLALLFLLRNAA